MSKTTSSWLHPTAESTCRAPLVLLDWLGLKHKVRVIKQGSADRYYLYVEHATSNESRAAATRQLLTKVWKAEPGKVLDFSICDTDTNPGTALKVAVSGESQLGFQLLSSSATCSIHSVCHPVLPVRCLCRKASHSFNARVPFTQFMHSSAGDPNPTMPTYKCQATLAITRLCPWSCLPEHVLA